MDSRPPQRALHITGKDPEDFMAITPEHRMDDLDWNMPEFAASRVFERVFADGMALVEQIVDGMSVMVIFQGPQAYISPNWYPS